MVSSTSWGSVIHSQNLYVEKKFWLSQSWVHVSPWISAWIQAQQYMPQKENFVLRPGALNGHHRHMGSLNSFSNQYQSPHVSDGVKKKKDAICHLLSAVITEITVHWRNANVFAANNQSKVFTFLLNRQVSPPSVWRTAGSGHCKIFPVKLFRLRVAGASWIFLLLVFSLSNEVFAFVVNTLAASAMQFVQYIYLQ